ncbi:MAG: family 10 glycosylhydrolase [Telluria sp.]
MKFGVSPSGIYRSSADPAVGSPTSSGALQHYSAMFADSRKWLQSGWLDYLAPQVYWYIAQAGSDYKLLVPWWNNYAFGRHIYTGLADYKMNTAGWTSPSQIADQIAINRANANVFGQVHFRHTFLQNNPLNYRTDLKDNIYRKPALLPAMPWKDNVQPQTPVAITPSLNADCSVSLSWTAPETGTGDFDKVRRYAVYRSEQNSIDTEDAANLVGITNAAETAYTDRTAEPGKFYFYSVTTLNRLHHESAAANTASSDTEAPTVQVQGITRSLLGGTISIAAAEVDNGSTDNWGIASLALDRTDFSCSNIGDNQVVLTATDKAGNASSASATVTVLGAVPAPAIAVSRADDTATGQPANTIVLGYGAQSVTLTASDASAGSASGFVWTPGDGLSGTNGASTQFTPLAPGSYALRVQAANQYGCRADTTVTIPVIDARCKGNKVLVCKSTGSGSNPAQELCVPDNAVPAHLKGGAVLGACS